MVREGACPSRTIPQMFARIRLKTDALVLKVFPNLFPAAICLGVLQLGHSPSFSMTTSELSTYLSNIFKILPTSYNPECV
jgi:hypothetical protein